MSDVSRELEPADAAGARTDRDHWDAYWDARWKGHALPAPATRGGDRVVDELLDRLDGCFARLGGREVLEIGGAPGRYLAYLMRAHGVRGTVIDWSAVGCELTRRNLALLGLDARVHELDVFDAPVELRRSFDAVFSLGFVEHFDDVGATLRAHLRYLKPGGLLVVGAPNMRGPYGMAFRYLDPAVLRAHVPLSSDPRGWDAALRDAGCTRLAGARLGGFSLAAVRGPVGARDDCPPQAAAVAALGLAARVQRALRRAADGGRVRSSRGAGAGRGARTGRELPPWVAWWQAYSVSAYVAGGDPGEG